MRVLVSRSWMLAGAVALLTACPLPMRRTPPEWPPEPGPPGNPAGTSLARSPELRVFVRAPKTTTYDPIALGPAARTVSLRLTNAAKTPVLVGRFDVTFRALREGVSFPCKGSAAPSENREPTSLAAGQSFDYVRAIECTMPLPGRYEIETYVRVEGAEASGGQEQRAGSFALNVAANGVTDPRPYPGRDGLHVLMTGGRVTRPLPPEAWQRGDYTVVVALINASPRPLVLGAVRLAFLVYKKGSPIPCAGQAEPFPTPDELDAGATYLARAPIACAPSEEGRYEVVGKLTLLDVGTELEVGRVPLKVTRDPFLYTPEPWPAFRERAPDAWTR